MSRSAVRSMPSASWAFVLAVLALLAVRAMHLTGPLDDPHSWRQCDTVWMSRTFARHGIDVLHPQVCWLGGHRTLIFELPLVEAITALLERAFGIADVWDRLVGLAFYLVATVYFHRIVRAVTGPRPARFATLAWLALPLSQFYSRAAHVDFAAVAFTHALVWHALQAVRRRSWWHALGAGVAGALGAMIKAPDLLPLLPPLLLVWLAMPDVPNLARLALAGLVTTGGFAVWRHHVNAVNAAAPDWSFLPGYYKEVNPWWWYFGNWGQRLERAAWVRLARRLAFDVATPFGAIVAVAGLTWRPWRNGGHAAHDAPRAVPFLLAWALGSALYLLVFFPLNVIHNYYQIPFVAPVALAIGLGIDRLMSRPVVGGLVLVAFVAGCFATIRGLHYYRVDWRRVEAGRAIEARTRPGDLVIAADEDAGYSDPRLLERADRAGWSVATPDLTPDRVRRLEAAGARWVAAVTDTARASIPPAWLAPGEVAAVPLARHGEALGTLHLYDPGRVPAGAR
ncbi:MAG TPA: glycosyltransferase family 39 protein [Candidatus Eisenbacteria bacterium]|nr:glycosyltransferase family 39 protein [Candidatus Eisenbacteria bacterium]